VHREIDDDAELCAAQTGKDVGVMRTHNTDADDLRTQRTFGLAICVMA
jgi:hypothetical protein